MLKTAIERTKLIESYVLEEEGKILYDAAKRSMLGVVEIGSFTGCSSIYLAQGAEDGNKVKVHCIDTWQDCDMHPGVDFYDEFCENTKQYKNTIKRYRYRSNLAANIFKDEYDVVFIDGYHTHEILYWDWGLWAMRIHNGEVYIHDVNCGWDAPRDLFTAIKAHGYKTEAFGNLGKVIIGNGISDLEKDVIKCEVVKK